MARWNDQESTGSGMFLLGAVAGALVGAGVALLMAPKPGSEVRQDINSGLNTMRDAASRRYRDLADKASAMADKASSAVERAANSVPGTTSGYQPSSPSGFQS